MSTRSSTFSSGRNLYKTARWRRLRQIWLNKHPYCQCPHHVGTKTRAAVVDHIKPHKGDARLFFNTNNLQSMTKECHDRYKQSMEKGGKGFDQGCDAQGNPLNRDARWYE